MKSPRDAAHDSTLAARLPSPGSEAHAVRAARWKQATSDFDLERLPLTFDVNAGETAIPGVH